METRVIGGKQVILLHASRVILYLEVIPGQIGHPYNGHINASNEFSS
jgi:hypothetical protein